MEFLKTMPHSNPTKQFGFLMIFWPAFSQGGVCPFSETHFRTLGDSPPAATPGRLETAWPCGRCQSMEYLVPLHLFYFYLSVSCTAACSLCSLLLWLAFKTLFKFWNDMFVRSSKSSTETPAPSTQLPPLVITQIVQDLERRHNGQDSSSVNIRTCVQIP